LNNNCKIKCKNNSKYAINKNSLFFYLGTYEEVQRTTQPTNPPEELYETITVDQKPSTHYEPQKEIQGVEMRKPLKPISQLKGLLNNESKVRVSMYGLIGYDCESDESEEDLLVSDPPLKVF